RPGHVPRGSARARRGARGRRGLRGRDLGGGSRPCGRLRLRRRRGPSRPRRRSARGRSRRRGGRPRRADGRTAMTEPKAATTERDIDETEDATDYTPETGFDVDPWKLSRKGLNLDWLSSNESLFAL